MIRTVLSPTAARLLAVLCMLFIAWLLLFALPARSAHAHDIWINKGGYRNLVGEWCCGSGDCGVVSPSAIHFGPAGYALHGSVTYGVGVTGNAADGPTRQESVNEVVPYSRAQPSPDGAYWRCKRPDGSPRCFFAPKPGS